MSLVDTLFVGLGSAVGAVGRYWLGLAIAKVNHSPFPWGTWIVNVMGTFLLGLFAVWFTIRHHDEVWWLVLGAGFCGGFTTFSTMSVEAVQLFRQDKMLAFVYIGSSLTLGLLVAWLVRWLL